MIMRLKKIAKVGNFQTITYCCVYTFKQWLIEEENNKGKKNTDFQRIKYATCKRRPLAKKILCKLKQFKVNKK